MQQHPEPFILGDFWIFPDGRRLPRLAGGQETDEEKAAREAREAEEKKKGEQKPPWGSDEEFDPARAWKLITDLRDDLAKVKSDRDDARSKVQEFEDREKTQAQKDAEARDTAAKEANESKAEAARLRVALKKGLSETQAKRLVGDSEEDLEKDADELLASFKDEEREGDEPPRRPRERLRSGAAPSSEPEETNPEKLAAQVPRMY